MQLPVIDVEGKMVNVIESIATRRFNEPLVHQVVTAYLAAARAGTKAQKTRAEVSGGGVKPWRQKGTGRARAGTIRSPLWRKGGVIFAAKPRNYEQKINKQMYRGAMSCILSELIRTQRIHLVESFELSSVKTKDFLKKLAELKITPPLMIVTDNVQNELYLASRNIHNVDISDVASLNPVSLIKNEKILMTASAYQRLEDLLK